MSVEGASIASMIKRFREGKPAPREERIRESGGYKKMWWETDSSFDGMELPRSLAIDPVQKPSKPEPLLRSRDSQDYMSDSIYNRASLGKSVDIDDMIEREIRLLETQVQDKGRKTNFLLNSGSFEQMSSLPRDWETKNQKFSKPSYNNISTGRSDYPISPLRLSGGGNLLRSSVETLGSTGFKGLLRPDLKLDGYKIEEDKKIDENGNMNELNSDLEALLKELNAGNPKSGYFPEGVDETIAQITNKLQTDMLEFVSLYGGKHLQEDEKETESKKRDEEMKEEGRNQERAKKLLELEHPAHFTHPLEYLNNLHRPLASTQFKDPLHPTSTSSNPPLPPNPLHFSGDGQNVRDSLSSPLFPHLQPQDHLPQRGAPGRQIQFVADVEVGAADEILRRMRSLRTGLDSRMRHLDALHNSISLPPAPLISDSDARTQQNTFFHGLPPLPRVFSGNPVLNPLTGTDRWGLERYQAMLLEGAERERKTQEERQEEKMLHWNPHAELVHKNILGVADTVKTALNSAMQTLEIRLGSEEKEVVMGEVEKKEEVASNMEDVVFNDREDRKDGNQVVEDAKEMTAKIASAFVENILNKTAGEKPYKFDEKPSNPPFIEKKISEDKVSLKDELQELDQLLEKSENFRKNISFSKVSEVNMINPNIIEKMKNKENDKNVDNLTHFDNFMEVNYSESKAKNLKYGTILDHKNPPFFNHPRSLIKEYLIPQDHFQNYPDIPARDHLWQKKTLTSMPTPSAPPSNLDFHIHNNNPESHRSFTSQHQQNKNIMPALNPFSTWAGESNRGYPSRPVEGTATLHLRREKQKSQIPSDLNSIHGYPYQTSKKTENYFPRERNVTGYINQNYSKNNNDSSSDSSGIRNGFLSGENDIFIPSSASFQDQKNFLIKMKKLRENMMS